MLTERHDIEGIKSKNIIDMALGFTAMTRIFSAKSKTKIVLSLPAASSDAVFSASGEGLPTHPGHL
jgi:hypothetical protein